MFSISKMSLVYRNQQTLYLFLCITITSTTQSITQQYYIYNHYILHTRNTSHTVIIIIICKNFHNLLIFSQYHINVLNTTYHYILHCSYYYNLLQRFNVYIQDILSLFHVLLLLCSTDKWFNVSLFYNAIE